jgi:hypothetical protein
MGAVAIEAVVGAARLGLRRELRGGFLENGRQGEPSARARARAPSETDLAARVGVV